MRHVANTSENAIEVGQKRVLDGIFQPVNEFGWSGKGDGNEPETVCFDAGVIDDSWDNRREVVGSHVHR